MKMKRIISMLITVMLIVSMLQGCAKKSSPDADSNSGSQKKSETTDAANDKPYHATLMYLVGSDSKDQSLISDAVNKLSKEQLNMTIDLLPVTMGSYSQQIQLMLSGGEPLDVFPIFSFNANTFMQSSYVVDLSKMIEDKGKDILSIVGKDDVWCSNVNGFLWGVPTMHERANPCALVVRTDILKETGEKAEDIKTLEDITSLFEKVKKLHPDMVCYSGSNTNSIPQISNMYDGLQDGLGVLADMGQTTKVTNWYENDTFKEQTKVMRDWFEKGFTSKDMPTTTDPSEAIMKAGNTFSFSVSYKPNTKSEKDAMTGYDTTVIPITQPLLTSTATAGGYGIAVNSENPEKAMELLNWLYKTPEVNDLLNWGIEGKHWAVKSDGTIDYPEGITADSCGYHQDFGWAIPNQYIAHVWTGNDPKIFDSYQTFRDNATQSKAYGFTYDNKDVINEVTAAKSICDQYLISICTGAVDPAKALPEFNQALYNAGLQKIIDEKQKQLDEWLASKSK